MRLEYRKDEMLKRSPLSLIANWGDLHCQVFAHELLCRTEIGGHSAPHELRRKVSGLISHEVVLIDSLPERGIAATGAYGFIWPGWVKDAIDTWLLRQISAAPLVKSYEGRR